jgi:O-antigen/teichoic acid export membrane protein
MDRYDVLTGVTIVASITRASLAVAVLRSGYGIVALAVVVLVVSFAELIALFRAARCLYPQLRLQVGLVNKAMVGELVSFGVYRFVWVVANQLIFYSDSLVIGMFLNAASITYFALAGSLINYARNVVSVAIDTLLPSASRLHSLNDMTGLRKLHIAGTRLSLLIGLPICAGLLFLGKQFLTLWMGPNYDLSAHLLAILTLAQFLSMPQYISSLVLVGMARHKVLAQLALAEGLVNISGSILLVGKAGLIGVAWATVVPHVIATGIVLPLYTLSVLNAKVGEYWWDGWARPAVCAAPGVVLCYGLSRVINHPSWGIFLCEVTAVAVTVAVPAYFICLTHTQRSAARAKWRYALARVSM